MYGECDVVAAAAGVVVVVVGVGYAEGRTVAGAEVVVDDTLVEP